MLADCPARLVSQADIQVDIQAIRPTEASPIRQFRERIIRCNGRVSARSLSFCSRRIKIRLNPEFLATSGQSGSHARVECRLAMNATLLRCALALALTALGGYYGLTVHLKADDTWTMTAARAQARPDVEE